MRCQECAIQIQTFAHIYAYMLNNKFRLYIFKSDATVFTLIGWNVKIEKIIINQSSSVLNLSLITLFKIRCSNRAWKSDMFYSGVVSSVPQRAERGEVVHS